MTSDILLVAIAAGTSTLTAITGIGGGMMLIAIMPGFLPAAAIVPVHAAVQLFSNSSRAFFGWRFIRWEFVLGFVGGAIAGGAIAAGITREIDLQYSPLFIAAYILYSVWGPGLKLNIPHRRGSNRPQHDRRRHRPARPGGPGKARIAARRAGG
jgi:uncharacterized membrane protein YfcA